MKPNEGATDRTVRLILGSVLIFASFLLLGLMDGAILGIVAAVIGAVLVVTAILGFCPAYKICGLSTCAVKPAP